MNSPVPAPLTPAQRRYLATEATIAGAINAGLSFAFVLLMFGGQASVPVAGAHGLIVDALPQSFMVAAMSTLVPTLLTRRRVASGRVAPDIGAVRPARPALLLALLVGVAVAVVAGGAHAVLLPLTTDPWSFRAVVVFKMLYGALLGAAIAWRAARAALGQAASLSRS